MPQNKVRARRRNEEDVALPPGGDGSKGRKKKKQKVSNKTKQVVKKVCPSQILDAEWQNLRFTNCLLNPRLRPDHVKLVEILMGTNAIPVRDVASIVADYTSCSLRLLEDRLELHHGLLKKYHPFPRERLFTAEALCMLRTVDEV